MKNLKNLNREELKEVIEEASFLLAVHQESNSPNKEVFYYCLVSCLKKLSITSPPYGSIKKMPYYKKFLEVSEFVDSYINITMKLNKVERSKAYFMFINLVINNLQSNTEIPVSINTVLNTFSYLPQIIQTSFPSYAESGLLKTVIEKWSEK